MDLKARIKGVDYPVNRGVPITDTYSETLDSATVVISHVDSEDEVLKSLKPYDDVYIYSGDWDDITHALHEVAVPSDGQFYRHMLIGENISLLQFIIDGSVDNVKFDLVSETKGLENVPMPNRTVTQPRKGYSGVSLSVYDVAKEFVDKYSPRIKVADANGMTWHYEKKYVLSDDVKEKFSKITCIETAFQNPNLRDVLTQIFQTADCIPVVHDGVIGFIDLSKRNSLIGGNEFNPITGHKPIVGASWINRTINGGEYSDRLRRSYSGAISKDTVTRYVEKLGFRNTGTAMMKLSDLKISTAHPIYRIKKFRICYYREIPYTRTIAMVKQDITPLVVLSSKRNMLSMNWNEFNNHPPMTLEGYNDFQGNYVKGWSDYKFCTVGYNIGDNSITGWGDMLQFTTDGMFQTKRSYIENILNIANAMNPYGCDFDFRGAGLSPDSGIIQSPENIPFTLNGDNHIVTSSNATESMISPAEVEIPQNFWTTTFVIGNFLTPTSVKLKTVFFEIEYEGMIDSAVIYSKDYHDGDVIKNDGSSSSLSVVESDGIMEKEKANKLGNAVVSIPARVLRLSDVRDLGDYTDEDEIIYQRTMTFEKDYISVLYYLCKDYVLKNYYTSVWAKHRPYALASYEESVSRNENHNLIVLVSDKTQLYQSSSEQFYALPDDLVHKLLSFFVETVVQNTFPSEYDVGEINSSFIIHYWENEGRDANGELEETLIEEYPSLGDIPPDKPFGWLALNKEDNGIYRYNGTKWIFVGYHDPIETFLTDTQCYVAGYSLCYTVSMTDNVTSGVFVKQVNQTFGDNLLRRVKGEYSPTDYSMYQYKDTPIDDIVGTVQDWYMINDDAQSGRTLDLVFGISSYNADGTENDLWEHSYRWSTLAEKGARENIISSCYSASGYYLKDEDNSGAYYKLFAMPKATYKLDDQGVFASDAILVKDGPKDGKEKINSTIQFEFVSDSPNIRFSQYLPRLSSMRGWDRKAWSDQSSYKDTICVCATTCIYSQYRNIGMSFASNVYYGYVLPYLLLVVPEEIIPRLPEDFSVDAPIIQFQSEVPVEHDPEAEKTFHEGIDTVIYHGKLEGDFVAGKATLQVKKINYVTPTRASVQAELRYYLSASDEWQTATMDLELTDVDDVNYTGPVPKTRVLGQKTFSGVLVGTPSNPIGFTYLYSGCTQSACYDMGDYQGASEYLFNGSLYNIVEWDYDSGGNLTTNTHSIGSFLQIYSLTITDFMIGKTLRAFYCPEKVGMVISDEEFSDTPSSFVELEYGTEFRISISADNVLHMSADKWGSPFGDGDGSLRVYYYDSLDEKWHFVYGANSYFGGSARVLAKSYISLVDDRSRTIFGSDGQIVGKAVNYAEDDGYMVYGMSNFYSEDGSPSNFLNGLTLYLVSTEQAQAGNRSILNPNGVAVMEAVFIRNGQTVIRYVSLDSLVSSDPTIVSVEPNILLPNTYLLRWKRAGQVQLTGSIDNGGYRASAINICRAIGLSIGDNDIIEINASHAKLAHFYPNFPSPIREVTADCTWSSSNTAVATVLDTPSGIEVHAVGYGQATITATCTIDLQEYTASIVVSVLGGSLKVSGADSLLVNGTEQLTASLIVNEVPTDVTSTATWNSEDTAIATVSANGVVSGISEGTVRITATYMGLTATHLIMVNPQ